MDEAMKAAIESNTAPTGRDHARDIGEHRLAAGNAQEDAR
jgi:hypothetical protein